MALEAGTRLKRNGSVRWAWTDAIEMMRAPQKLAAHIQRPGLDGKILDIRLVKFFKSILLILSSKI